MTRSDRRQRRKSATRRVVALVASAVGVIAVVAAVAVGCSKGQAARTAGPGPSTLGASAVQTASVAASPTLASSATSQAGSSVASSASTATSTAPGGSREASAQAGGDGAVSSAVPSAESSATEYPLNIDRFLGKPVHSVVTRKNEVALTFDDGPSHDTEPVVDILKKAGVNATFFFCGRTLRGPGKPYARYAAAAGNDIGNHTTHHKKLVGLTSDKMATEVLANQKRIADLVGYQPRFVRPMAGVFDSDAVGKVADRRLILMLWSVTGNDADVGATPSSIAHDATTGVSRGSIILLHETNPDTVKALPKILAKLKAKGLKPVTLSKLLADSTAFR